MKLYLVRHGETDWKQLEARGVRGHARSFAPLTPLGRIQIDAIANDYRLKDAEAILCSSYARALESGARLSRVLNKPLYVEYDLHEWLPQKDPSGELTEAVIANAARELSYYTGYYPGPDRRSRRRGPPPPGVEERRVPVEQRRIPPPHERTWESLDEVKARVLGVLRRYRQFERIVMVSHAVVMTSLIGVRRPIEFAEIVPVEIDLDAPLTSSAGETTKAPAP
jgi:broad specificity phosphatase PhoE